jgi:hypothetical protein
MVASVERSLPHRTGEAEREGSVRTGSALRKQQADLPRCPTIAQIIRAAIRTCSRNHV